MKENDNNNMHDEIIMDDEVLLKTVTKQQLVDLCTNLQLSGKGTKTVLLKRLRQHAAQQAAAERAVVMERRLSKVQGDVLSLTAKERHEIVGSSHDEPDDDDDDVFGDCYFYFALPDDAINVTTTTEAKVSKNKTPSKTTIPNSVITAPPPPAQPNANGERVVTIYNTADQNDLTGIAAAQPGQAALQDNLATTAGTSSSTNNHQPWDAARTSTTTTAQEHEKAKETLIELVTQLLAMTGAPAFASLIDDDDDNDFSQKFPSFVPTGGFTGFDPSLVPTELLTASSQALRTGRGQVLQDVLRQFELQGIGQDGLHGDDVEKGGGHYRQVQKVGAFLDGYRRAEVRRLARETAALLLDKLVAEGVDGLDLALASMARSNDDTSTDNPELNDSLLDYLNDAIRQQERKVDQLIAKQQQQQDLQQQQNADLEQFVNGDKQELSEQEQQPDDDEDAILNSLWNVTHEKDGQRVESIDPNDPKVQLWLEKEKQQQAAQTQIEPDTDSSSSAAEQLLLLLTLLRERIKAEAAFGPDEKGRNLRLLAYCLQVKTDEEREQLILKEVGNSLERLDSFLELVASSIEYGESTSYQLQPAKKISLNVPQLKSIHDLVEHLRERQTWKAATGGAP